MSPSPKRPFSRDQRTTIIHGMLALNVGLLMYLGRIERTRRIGV
jgi:hypothetical protein